MNNLDIRTSPSAVIRDGCRKGSCSFASVVNGKLVRRIGAARIACVFWRRPESLVLMCKLISIGVLLWGLMSGHTGWMLDPGIIRMSYVIL